MDKYRRCHRWYVVTLLIGDSCLVLTVLRSFHRVRPTAHVNAVGTRANPDLVQPASPLLPATGKDRLPKYAVAAPLLGMSLLTWD